ncbi:putative Fringe-related protein [Hibiscus syriacus]|uniref:Fringe-related protein n=1 Tax=Hibiscus syriacus TaxID=106335 RepID=A0A6A3C2A0_HIBSY|nr:putative Fringe-related protein [Hibiscus syriacus]
MRSKLEKPFHCFLDLSQACPFFPPFDFRSLLILHAPPPVSSPKPNSTEKTTLHHIVIGIAASAGLWDQSKNYIKLWRNPRQMRGVVWLDKGVKSGTDDHLLPPRIVSAERPPVCYKDIPHSIGNSKAGLGRCEMIGSSSESHLQKINFSHGMAYGGGGFAISYPLAKALEKVQDRCIQRYRDCTAPMIGFTPAWRSSVFPSPRNRDFTWFACFSFTFLYVVHITALTGNNQHSFWKPTCVLVHMLVHFNESVDQPNSPKPKPFYTPAFEVLAEKNCWQSASLDCAFMFAAELLGDHAPEEEYGRHRGVVETADGCS